MAAAIIGVVLQAVATGAYGELRFTDVSAAAALTAARSPLPDGVPAMGGGGAVGDFNNDGWQDLLFLAGGGGADALYLNNGDGTFSDHAQEAGLAAAHRGIGAAIGDYDGDGWLDQAGNGSNCDSTVGSRLARLSECLDSLGILQRETSPRFAETSASWMFSSR